MNKNKLKQNTLPVCLIIAFLFVIGIAIYAQAAVIRGVVIDQEGNPLINVKITLLDPSRGFKFDLKSDKKGNFIKAGIPSATYRITAELEGYVPFGSQIQIQMGMEERITIKLNKIAARLDEDQDFAEGTDLFIKQQYMEAITSFEKVVEKFPGHFEGFYNLGLAHLRADHIDQSIVSFEKAIELNPDSYESFRALGESYFQKGETEKAAEILAHAVSLKPDNPMSYFNLGLAYEKMDKPEDALQAYQKAIELQPDLSAPYYHAALVLIRMQNYKNAIEYLERFLELEPDAPEASQVKAMIEELKK